MNDRERIGAAFHEAGHAAMGLLLGRPPKSASIVRDGDMAGAVTFDRDWPQSALNYFNKSREKRLYLEMRVMVTLAGTVAHDTMEPGRVHDSADEMDQDQAIKLLQHWEATDKERAAWLKELASRTRETLVANRHMIEAISSSLLEHNALSREDLLALYGRERIMDDTDRIVAAIFAAGMCQGKSMADYFEMYDQCLANFHKRDEAAKKEKRVNMKQKVKGALGNPKLQGKPRR